VLYPTELWVRGDELCTHPRWPASVLAFGAMRTTIALSLLIALAACDSGENAGREAAKRQQAEELKHAAAGTEAAKKISPPVPGRAKLDCKNVIDAEKFTQLLGESTPLTVVDSKSEPEAAASCSLMRGGKRPSDAEQKAIIKEKGGRLGVIPGDELCNVSTFCWTIEDPDRFMKKCAELKEKTDNSLGFAACVLVVATGEDDVNRYRFFDDDTKCIIQVRGGPSNVDNDLIGKCAKAAHDLIGPDQIKVTASAGSAGSGS
jgi:hypothetical protein